MEAIEPEDLVEYFAEQEALAVHAFDVPTKEDVMYEEMAACDNQQYPKVSEMNATEVLHWQLYNRQLGDCPKCGQRFVELTSFECPDMYGETYGWTFECCGYTWSRNTFLVYGYNGHDEDEWPNDPHGRHVDVR